jgi:hypothetical protein
MNTDFYVRIDGEVRFHVSIAENEREGWIAVEGFDGKSLYTCTDSLRLKTVPRKQICIVKEPVIFGSSDGNLILISVIFD